MNTKTVNPAEARTLLRSVQALRQLSGQVSSREIRAQLDAPLLEAVNILRTVRPAPAISPFPNASDGRRSTVPGGRVGRMLQAYLMRIQGKSAILGQQTADRLSVQAYRILVQVDETGTTAVPVISRR